jgi:glycerol-3-phosphate dehydrogenase
MEVFDTWRRLFGTWTTTSRRAKFLVARTVLTIFRYKLVVEALRERRYFLDTAPHLSSWLPIMIPIGKWWQAPYFWAGTKFYDFLAGSENIESSYFLTKSKALDAFPMLKKEGLFGALVYYGKSCCASRRL